MKLQLDTLDITVDSGNVFIANVRAPGVIQHAFAIMRPKSRIALRHEPEPTELVVRLLLETHPDAAIERRRFVTMPLGKPIDTDEEGCPFKRGFVFVKAVIDPRNGAPVVLYEAPLSDEEGATLDPDICRCGRNREAAVHAPESQGALNGHLFEGVPR